MHLRNGGTSASTRADVARSALRSPASRRSERPRTIPSLGAHEESKAPKEHAKFCYRSYAGWDVNWFGPFGRATNLCLLATDRGWQKSPAVVRTRRALSRIRPPTLVPACRRAEGTGPGPATCRARLRSRVPDRGSNEWLRLLCPLREWCPSVPPAPRAHVRAGNGEVSWNGVV